MRSSLLQRCAAEALGTGAIVFFGCGAIALHESLPASLSVAMIAVVFGLVVAAMIYALGHISGAHMNPAVTCTFAVTRHFPASEVVAYCASQIAGAIGASALPHTLFPASELLGATLPHVATIQAFLWEGVLSFFLMLVIMAVATDTRAVGIMAGAAIGAVVLLDAAVGGWATGASMNPARSIGPALISGHTESLWLYVAAPIAGCLVAGLVYKAIGTSPEASN